MWNRSGTRTCDNPAAEKNPARGFYRVYTYDIAKEEAEEDWIWSLCRDERLALVLLDIGKCAHRALLPGELAKVERIFSLFRDNGMQMIVRAVYDRVGRGPEHEPETSGQVMEHMRQLGPLLSAFSAHIFTVQGLFVGSWGEMHDSKFLGHEMLVRLYDTLREASGDVPVSVRKPQYQRILRLHNGEICTGLYDDAILASGTDMGTFGWIDDVKNPDIMWTPERELEFMQLQNAYTPCGGEVLSGALAYSPHEVLARMELMQLTYLNSVHEPAVWDSWRRWAYPTDKSSVCGEKKTFFDEIRARLGYRFELTEITLAGSRLTLAIANTGFACCYDAVRVILGCGSVRLESVLDGRRPAAGETVCVEFEIGQAMAQDEEELILSVALRHEKTGLPIYFARACGFSDADRWERYRSMSALPEGISVGVLLKEKEAIS